MASYDEYVELDAADAEADAKLGASEAALASCKEGQCEPRLDCLDLDPSPILHGTSGQTDEEHAADGDDREPGGGRTKPSQRRHVLNARYSTYAAATRPLRPL